ncbi:hypothetical protein K474DRAFT_1292761 [Panus rudis PR-1116 ss-1]|nr:hypothetical protein K474DRAFT_1292761 [Panus rudis PR-1116 ss-1]
MPVPQNIHGPKLHSPPSPLMFMPPQTESSPQQHSKRLLCSPPSGVAETQLGILITDALIARDIAVRHLQNACASIRAKDVLIEKLERENQERTHDNNDGGTTPLDSDAITQALKVDELTKANDQLKKQIEVLERAQRTLSPTIESKYDDIYFRGLSIPSENVEKLTNSPILSAPLNTPKIPAEDDLESRVQARFSILSTLPIPPEMPDDILVPIVIPPPFNIHDFMGSMTGALKSRLANYRVFQECTTAWCPDREENGYFLTPVFKCITNPRTVTAHRWMPVDIAAKLNKPMECFYNKEGKWYYAGVYKALRLEDFSVGEWHKLSHEATQTIIKETLAGRKNTCPQNIYETGQLYAAGALKVACIGLQCIGFDSNIYKALLEHADLCAKTGRWRAAPNAGLGPSGGNWNTLANATHPARPTLDTAGNS